MPNSTATKIVAELRALSSRIDEQRAEMSSLRVRLEIQFKRIACLQAELDVLPTARKERRTQRLLLLSAAGPHPVPARQPQPSAVAKPFE
jgi:hypothetical protein